MNGGLVRLKESLVSLKPSERTAAEYILQHPERMLDQSIAQLAEASGSSQAAIVRLCKTLGVKGYQELKLKVAGDLQTISTGSNGYEDIKPKDSISTIIHNVSNNNVQSLRDTVKVLDVVQVERAIRALHRANRIYLYGLGASNLIAQDAQQKFLRINKPCFCYADPHMQLVSAVTLTDKDVAVGISYSGETKQVLAALKQAGEQGAVTISLTKYGPNSLSSNADISLYISSTEHEIRSAAIGSRIAQLNVIDILFLGVASMNYDQSVSYLNETRAIVRRIEDGK